MTEVPKTTDLNYTAIPDTINEHLKRIGERAFSTFTTVQNTYLCACALLDDSVPGCFIECGIANGSQIGAMCCALYYKHERRTLHLFDSFQGIPYAGPNDADQPGFGHIIADQNKPLRERLVSTGVSGNSVAGVKSHMDMWGFSSLEGHMIYHEGWFQDTLPGQVPDEPIALLRLDGDLYESTEVCLAHLADRVARGSIIIIDDYALPGCRKAVDEYLAKRGLNPTIESVPESTVKWWRVA